VIWIGVDAHKRVHQAVAIAETGELATRTISNSPEDWSALLAWAQQWPERVWAVEGAWYLGRGLAQFLVTQGEQVHEVNGRWTAGRRRFMRRPGKSDRLDARAVAQLLREEGNTLPRVYTEDSELAQVELWSRMQAEFTEDLTRLVNRLHNLLLRCDPQYQGKLPALTTKAGIAAVRQYVAPGADLLARECEQMVRRIADQLALRDAQDRELRSKLERVSKTRFSPLRQIQGVGPLIACGVVAELGGPHPGLGEEQLAAIAAAAPLEASGAGGVRHRLNRGGNRRLNMLLHQIALTQERIYGPARTYVAKRRAEGRTAREARRALKRFIARRVWHAWVACFADLRTVAA
jgi:transposase